MELGIDSFASTNLDSQVAEKTTTEIAMAQLLERIVHAEKAGFDLFGIGEHHRKDFWIRLQL